MFKRRDWAHMHGHDGEGSSDDDSSGNFTKQTKGSTMRSQGWSYESVPLLQKTPAVQGIPLAIQRQTTVATAVKHIHLLSLMVLSQTVTKKQILCPVQGDCKTCLKTIMRNLQNLA